MKSVKFNCITGYVEPATVRHRRKFNIVTEKQIKIFMQGRQFNFKFLKTELHPLVKTGSMILMNDYNVIKT